MTPAETARSSRRSLGEGGRLDEPAAYHDEGILYLPAEARFDYLLMIEGGLDYEGFLVERKKLMAAKVKQYFHAL